MSRLGFKTTLPTALLVQLWREGDSIFAEIEDGTLPLQKILAQLKIRVKHGT
jgi:hypothetical protein